MMNLVFTSLNDVEFVDKNDILGSGALSQVRKVRVKSNGKIYALKEMNLNTIHPNDLRNIEREVKTQKRLDHPNVVHLYEYIKTDNNVMYLLLEYADNNNMFHYIQKTKPDERMIHKLFFQTVQAIEYIHNKNIMHRDLKPENILLDANFNAKVCDFGWCAEWNEIERRQTFCGTNEYMAPEIHAAQKQDFMIDIWAMGILLYEMYHKRAPFTGRSPKDIYENISKKRIKYTANPMCPEAKDMIDRILQLNPKNRLKIDQIFAHPYFSKFPFFRLNTPDVKNFQSKTTRRSYVGLTETNRLGATQSTQQTIPTIVEQPQPKITLKQSLETAPSYNFIKSSNLPYQDNLKTNYQNLPSYNNSPIPTQSPQPNGSSNVSPGLQQNQTRIGRGTQYIAQPSSMNHMIVSPINNSYQGTQNSSLNSSYSNSPVLMNQMKPHPQRNVIVLQSSSPNVNSISPNVSYNPQNLQNQVPLNVTPSSQYYQQKQGTSVPLDPIVSLENSIVRSQSEHLQGNGAIVITSSKIEGSNQYEEANKRGNNTPIGGGASDGLSNYILQNKQYPNSLPKLEYSPSGNREIPPTYRNIL